MQPQHTAETLQMSQKQMVQRENMAYFGQLTSGIAHEIHNPLNFVKNFSESCLELMNDWQGTERQEDAACLAKEIKENLDKVVYYSKRAEAVVNNMMEHSRISRSEKQKVDIDLLITEVFRQEYACIQKKYDGFEMTTTLKFEATDSSIIVNPQEIAKVISNILKNAFYAIHEKKSILDGSYIPALTITTKRNENTFEILINDNGTGIPAPVVPRIFQHFFTTKPAGEGTGLGLSLSYDIVTNGHCGEIMVDTQEGEYTEFTIVLPV